MMDKFDHLDTFIRPQQAWELLGMKKTAFYAKVKSRAAGFPKIYKNGRMRLVSLRELIAYQNQIRSTNL